MRDNIYGYDSGGYAIWQQNICGTTEMAKCVERTVMDWANIDREGLLT